MVSLKRKVEDDEPKKEGLEQRSPPKRARKPAAAKAGTETGEPRRSTRAKREAKAAADPPQPRSQAKKGMSAKKADEKKETTTSTKGTTKAAGKKLVSSAKQSSKKSSDGVSKAQSTSKKADKDNEAVEDSKASDGHSYWLMKAEPETRLVKGKDVAFSIDHLCAAKEPEPWDGVRNPVARNNMRAMKKGDYAFFYHSNCKKPGIVGIMEIVQEHSVDESAFDPTHPYYDEKSTREKPRWEVVHVEFRRKFDEIISLDQLKSFAKPGGALENLQTLRMSRLSVSAVSPKEWEFIMGLIQSSKDDSQ